jgi:hypothetical protein
MKHGIGSPVVAIVGLFRYVKGPSSDTGSFVTSPGGRWRERLRSRLPSALAAVAATAGLYAEGVLKDGLIAVALLLPVVWFLVAPEPGATSLLRNLLVSLIAVCVAFICLDLALRPLIGHRLHYTPTNIASRKLPRLPIVGRWDPNLVFDLESYGDLAAILGDVSARQPRRIVFRTDSSGFRNAADPGAIDLLILGDSFGAGAGTTEERIFANLLASRYGRRTYNLSYPGGPYDQFVNFAIESPRLTFVPGAVLVWTLYAGNDLDDAGGESWDLERLPWRGTVGQWQVRSRTFRNRSPINQMMKGLRWRLSGTPGGVIVRHLPNGQPMLFQASHEAWGSRPRAEVEQSPNFSKLERTFAAMRTLVGRRGLDLTVLILPTKGEVYAWILEERAPAPEDARSSGFALAVLDACERAGLRCLDTKPYLVEEARRLFPASGDLLWWRDDTHLGERGHEALTTLIGEQILGLKPREISGYGNRRL